jgi:hypothetical protein
MTELAIKWTVPGVTYPETPIKINPTPEQIQDIKRLHWRAEYYTRRTRFFASGLNANGKPRKRNYVKLDGMTGEQKCERNKQQQSAWRAAHPNGKGGAK